MAFDWIRFFERHGVAFASSGANVSRGNVAIHCPFCGSDDAGQHMSVSTDGRGWRCFRRHDHRGKSPARLVQALLGCSSEQARALVGGTFVPDDFMAAVSRAMATPQHVEADRPVLRMPPEFKRFARLPSSKLFIRYLRDRDFSDEQIERLSPRYDIRYCTVGPYRGRIVFPVKFEDQLVSWTGRSIYPTALLRYRALTNDVERAREEGMGQAMGPISHFLLWYDKLMKADADTLCLCEGPFDALKVDMLGAGDGVRATCFFTSGPTAPQIALLHTLLPRYRHRYLLLDRGTLPNAIRIQGQLTGLGVELVELPSALKDPGELRTRRQLLKLIVDHSKGSR